MSFITFIFYFFTAMTAIAAIAILLSNNVFKAALLLLVCLLSVAALYVMAFAEFIAIAQILIYAGGVLVVIIFAIMLTGKQSGKILHTGHAHLFSGILAGSLLLALLITLISGSGITQTSIADPSTGSMQTIGINLITKFALPFEVSGILLLMALIGAAVIASYMKSKKSNVPD